MKSPFKFLDSYTKEDRGIFFGHEREVEELYHRVFESRIMLVYGISGTGKSSLIHCGLANKFQDTDWLPVIVRRGVNIIDSMAEGINAASLTEKHASLNSSAAFRKAVKSLYLDYYKPVFFIFDQFEELFIFGSKEERKEFIQVVKILTESDLQCRMIFVMREEYMAGVTEFEKYIPSFFSNRVRIEKMSHSSAVNVIERPCNVAGIMLENGFAEALLQRLSPGEADVELTYLQVYLDKIFRLADIQSKEGITFSEEMLNKAGNVSDLLGAFLDEQISNFDDPAAGLSVLKAFVSIQGTKQQMTSAEASGYLRSLGQSLNETFVNDLVQVFVRLRILCDKDQNDRYELRHDALAEKIYEKFTLAEKELLEVRKFIENAYYSYQRRNIYLTKQDLDYLSDYEDKLLLPGNLSEFIAASRREMLNRKRAMKRVTLITTLVFFVVLALVLRFYLTTVAKNSPSNLFRSALVKSANSHLGGLLAELDLWETDSVSAELHKFILKDFELLMNEKSDGGPLSELQKKMTPVKFGSSIVKASISDRGNLIYGWLEDGEVFIYNPDDNLKAGFKASGVPVSITLSEERSMMSIVFDDGEVSVCDYNGKTLFSCGTKLNEKLNDKLVRFFPAGKRLLACADGQCAFIYDTAGNMVEELPVRSGAINSIDISPDGLFIVTVADKLGYIWRSDVEGSKFRLFETLKGHYGEVWSCRFNKTGRYIITASADSTIRIWDLNGTHINSEFQFNTMAGHVRLNNREPDEDRTNPLFARYYGKFCDAAFSKSELEIIATGYDDKGGSGREDNYYKILFFDGIGGFPYSHGRRSFMGTNDYNSMNIEFNDFVLSPKNSVGAVTNSSDSDVYIISGLNYVLMKLKGRNPFFDVSGKYLYSVNGNAIYKIPVEPAWIKKLINPLIGYKPPLEDYLLIL